MSRNKLLTLLLLAVTLLSCSCTQDFTTDNNNAHKTDTKIKLEEDIPDSEENKTSITYINPLTGLETREDLTHKRPVTIMINNIYNALPQVGISEADIVYEILEEGGITRLLCVYNDFEEIPEIGSVRSTRDYYIDVADAHDAILVHAGGSTYAYSDLAERNTDNIDGLYASQFYRSAERRKTMSKEHTLMISGSGLSEAVSQYGYRTDSESPCPLSFSHNYSAGTDVATHISFPFSIGYNSNPYVKAFFDYNEETKEYLKGQFKQPHIDGDDGTQLSFKNVITLTCPMNIIKGDPLGCIQVHFTGTGTGTYSVDGTYREIVWKKPSRDSAYTLYEATEKHPSCFLPARAILPLFPQEQI